jgi:6-phospho-3-hexuloisomerase
MECSYLKAIIHELREYAQNIQEEQIQAATAAILKARKVFVTGAGRSGFAARAFANRLFHLGLSAYFVGESTTPPIAEGDLLVIGSGSGTTAGLVAIANKAKAVNASIATVTIAPENTIGKMADVVIAIPGTTRQLENSDHKEQGSIQPIGSMFEQLSWLVYDSIVMYLKAATKQTNDDLIARHGNLE